MISFSEHILREKKNSMEKEKGKWEGKEKENSSVSSSVEIL